MFFEISSGGHGCLVVDQQTRRLRHEVTGPDRTAFFGWLGADGRRAIGFASDLNVVHLPAGRESQYFVPMQISAVGQSIAIKQIDSASSWNARLGSELIFDRGWPSLWKVKKPDTFELSNKLTSLEILLSALRLDSKLDDLLRLSRISPQPETALLTEAVLQFAPSIEIDSIVPEIALGPGYPSMFDAIRRHFLTRAHLTRTFRPLVDWGGPQECVSAGAHTYGDPRILYYPPATVTFGRYCSIAEGVTIILANHVMSGATTYPFKLEEYRWPSQIAQSVLDFEPRDVVIGNDVWIGRGVTILCGAQIGDGAIIGADSVVRGTIPPYSVVVGNPGRVIRNRFETDIVTRFLRLRWWDWPDWKVDRHSTRMLSADPVAFLDAAEADND